MDILKNPITQIFIMFIFTVGIWSLTTNINGDYGVVTSELLLVVSYILFIFIVALKLGQIDGRDSHISHHWLRFLVRGIIILLLPILAFGISIETLGFFGLGAGIFSIIFPIFYNYEKDLYIFYVGKVANFDRAVRYINDLGLAKLYPYWLLLLEFGVVIFSTFLIVKN